MNKKEEAVALFNQGFSCSQAVLSVFASEFNLDKTAALRVAGGFGGGMGNLGETCGAVTGAFMVIGLKHGRTNIDDRIAKGKTYGFVRDFAQIYSAKRGSIKCKELLGCDLNTPEGMSYARENNLFKTLCPGLVEMAVEVLEEILQEE
ncbi:MAG: C_GCAxxG_C_C family protein [Clostridiaceae bacterium BRH_c20a]|nr:MAG: C_GCAxxG_C_C family protein [Clostridiaceae bacterium BRH_c20a]